MDIYKLKDEIPDEKASSRLTKSIRSDIIKRDVSSEVESSTGELKITNLKQGVKNPNRVNVFVNGKFSFSLDVAQVVDYKIKVGEVLSAKKLVELKNASEYGKLYQRTLEWVLVRPRSVREVEDYHVRKFRNTQRKGSIIKERQGDISSSGAISQNRYSQDEYFELSGSIISRLCEKGYIDDRKFAEWYVENRFVKKGVSQKRLRMELAKKGISQEVIDEVLVGRDDKTEIQKIIQRKRAKYDDEKLVAYLCRQGFSYDIARQAVVATYEDDNY